MAFGTRSTTFAFIGQDKFSPVADKVAGKSSSMGSKFAKAGKLVAKAGAVTAAAAAAAGYAGLKAVKSYETQATASARLAKVMESMGYERHAKAADKFADSIEQKIAVDSAEIKAAQAKLATFKDVAASTELMQRATMLAADSAAAGFGSMDTAAVGLGKALADPVNGMSLLTRQGSLTRAEQDKIAAAFEKTGDKAAAQESIMKALEKQVGGVAEATADSSDKMSLSLGEVTESIGGALAPAFDKLVPVVKRVSDWFVDVAMPAMKRFGEKIAPKVRDIMDAVKQAIADNRPELEKLGDILKTVGKFVTEVVIPAWMDWIEFVLPKAIKVIGWVADAITKIAPVVIKVAKVWVEGLGGMYDAVLALVENSVKLIAKIPGPWQDAMQSAADKVTKFRKDTASAFGKVGDVLDNAEQDVEDYNKAAKFKADISDSKKNIAELRSKLRDPELTKTRKAQIKADIKQAKQKVREARRRLNSLKDKTVHVKFSTTWTAAKVQKSWDAGRRAASRGGMNSAEGWSPSGLMSATRGAGSPGAGFAQWGPYWSWNRGPSGMGQHDGADISVGSGSPVYAPRSGSFAGRATGSWHGNMVQWMANGTLFKYAHLSRFGGTQPGGVIGYVGSTGNSSGPHLHIQASRAGRYVNPAAYLAGGGIVKRRPGGTVIVAGEGSHDEAVVPLKNGHTGGGAVINFYGPVYDKQGMVTELRKAFNDDARRTGRPLMTAGG